MESSFPLIGDKMPSITVTTTKGQMTLPEDLSGKWFVLFSHPADYTPVCTTEFVAFQKRYDEFRALNCELVGMSIDQVFSHIKWMEWIKEKLDVEIEFPVIADDMGTVAKTLGMIHPGKGTNTVRAVFIVDDKGYVRIIFYYPQELGRNMDEILRAVKGMQTSDKHGVAIPAGWPENELIKERVIVPPAQDVDAAKKRLDEFEGFDWWFCHKKI
ncbi:peroxiredoxin [Pseudodesulfovibrio senegalensis]|jgi:peroxiredoxin (alkyl hydroperoxide reductase subunit C)|uniref:Peroxiredoxin n=1 Tax=Pseudodesulfovibrio senegalensis TaxID=1721087 RepID=A0A6N6N2W9_9BACT|nr:peroxiredoxin [Pseudodesulfovibrio senegalensis]KAB1441382.1 peroxiredoxin [Pseudodesulfovibrio senegalensis]